MIVKSSLVEDVRVQTYLWTLPYLHTELSQVSTATSFPSFSNFTLVLPVDASCSDFIFPTAAGPRTKHTCQRAKGLPLSSLLGILHRRAEGQQAELATTTPTLTLVPNTLANRRHAMLSTFIKASREVGGRGRLHTLWSQGSLCGVMCLPFHFCLNQGNVVN